MIIYYVGMIIAMGFFIGIYCPDEKLQRHCLSVSDGSRDRAILLQFAMTGIVAIFSWVAIVAMIANQAYIRDKKEWNI